MFYCDVARRYKNGLIKRVIVVRFLRFSGTQKPKAKRVEADFHYLPILLPSPEIDDRDVFVMRDRSGERNRVRQFKSFFTVEKAMAAWGIDEYMVFDAARYTYIEDGIDELILRGYGVKPFRLRLEQLARDILKQDQENDQVKPSAP